VLRPARSAARAARRARAARSPPVSSCSRGRRWPSWGAGPRPRAAVGDSRRTGSTRCASAAAQTCAFRRGVNRFRSMVPTRVDPARLLSDHSQPKAIDTTGARVQMVASCTDAMSAFEVFPGRGGGRLVDEGRRPRSLEAPPRIGGGRLTSPRLPRLQFSKLPRELRDLPTDLRCVEGATRR